MTPQEIKLTYRVAELEKTVNDQQEIIKFFAEQLEDLRSKYRDMSKVIWEAPNE